MRVEAGSKGGPTDRRRPPPLLHSSAARHSAPARLTAPPLLEAAGVPFKSKGSRFRSDNPGPCCGLEIWKGKEDVKYAEIIKCL